MELRKYPIVQWTTLGCDVFLLGKVVDESSRNVTCFRPSNRCNKATFLKKGIDRIGIPAHSLCSHYLHVIEVGTKHHVLEVQGHYPFIINIGSAGIGNMMEGAPLDVVSLPSGLGFNSIIIL